MKFDALNLLLLKAENSQIKGKVLFFPSRRIGFQP